LKQGWGAGAPGRMIWSEPEPFYFFFRSRSGKRKLEWSRSWHKLLRLQAPAVFKNFVKIMIFDIILQDKKLIFFGFVVIEILFRHIKINDL